MFKHLTRILLCILFIYILMPTVEAKNKVNLYLFWGNGCPHCKDEKVYLEQLKDKYPGLNIYEYEVWYNQDNQQLLKNVAKLLNAKIEGVPFTVIGNNTFSGFSLDQSPPQFEQTIEYYIENGCHDLVGEMLGKVNSEDKNENKYCDTDKDYSIVSVPFIGKVNLNDMSLPIITIIFGLLDGFNPCAMWVLLFLISTLIGMHDRKKMWLLGLTFILTSALMYLLFMGAWLNIMLYIGALLWIRILIASVALIGGGVNLRAYCNTKDDGCKVVDDKKRDKIFDKITKFTHEKSFLLAIIGIILLAISVNFIELLCSAGLPVVYTQILALNNISGLGYYWYLLLYILFFMLDDIVIFIIAMITLQLTGISTKYVKYSHLIGGILMLLIGILLLFKPGWLMFG